jgi:hypothetical protein
LRANASSGAICPEYIGQAFNVILMRLRAQQFTELRW